MSNRAKLEALLSLINSAAQEAMAEYERAGEEVPSIDATGPHPLDNATDTVALKKAIRVLEGACGQLCTTLAPPAHTAINLVQIYDYACVRTALRENISDVLTAYPNGLHVNELGKLINIEPKKLSRIMRLLATRGCYTEVETDVFSNSRLSLILHTSHPARHMIGLHVEVCAKGAGVFYETLKEPDCALSYEPSKAPVMYAIKSEGIEGTFFDWMRMDDSRRVIYHQSMRGLNWIMGSLAVLYNYPFHEYTTVCDVGGGIGAFSLPLAKTHKHIKITIHDLPEALVQARDVWAAECPEAIQENRVEFVPLNFLTDTPVKGLDIYYLRNIIHDWPDDESALILRNVRKALGPHSRLLIHDYVLQHLSRKQANEDAKTHGAIIAPEPMLPNFGTGNIRMYQQDLSMWLLHNAKERTLQDSLALADAAGLRLEKIWDLAEACVLEYKLAD